MFIIVNDFLSSIGCGINEFKCDSICLPINKICDQIRDCRDGTDERNCTSNRPRGKSYGDFINVYLFITAYLWHGIGY